MVLVNMYQNVYVPEKRFELNEINVDYYRVNGKRGRVISIKRPELVEDIVVQKFGCEIYSLLKNIHFNFDPKSRYCIDFNGVNSVCPCAWDRIKFFHKRHEYLRNGERLSICSIDPRVGEVFGILRLKRMFDADYCNRDEFLESFFER